MAWMRMMGADSVAYHRATVLARGDDHPGAALAYYGSRGETPLVWGGSGADRLGLAGPVDEESFERIFGPGGACDPGSGRRLVRTRRPGMELVIAAHKSVAVLGVIGRADHMHAILDAERDATLDYLDALTRARGGRRGVAAVATPTSGMTWALTRHATSRSGDPAPHDHVLVANVVEMLDLKGGWKAPDTALWRDHLRAATAVGRMAAARRAVELGYAIERDDGPSGRLGHWRILGIPVEVERMFSKRSDEITAAVAERGVGSARARAVAARATRSGKRFTPVPDLMRGWHHELDGLGITPRDVAREVGAAGRRRNMPGPLTSQRLIDDLAADLVGIDGPLAERKVFTRADVIVAAAPRLFGRTADQLDRAVTAVLGHAETVPLVELANARERTYTTATTLAVEHAIATLAVEGAGRADAAVVPEAVVEHVMAAGAARRGVELNDGQAAAVRGITTSGRGVDVVIGVAGAGKTTALGVAREAFDAAGYTVLGTSTSGQAVRTLGREAGLGESRTVASLLWRLEHGRQQLTARHVLILDEAGMTSDRDLLRVLAAARESGTKVIVVGDDRQLGAVGPGGGLTGLLTRVPGAVHVLGDNLRQHDPGERRALEELRAGDVTQAVDWYVANGRIAIAPTLGGALHNVVAAWHADTRAGLDAAMYAWRRDHVAQLNQLARQTRIAAGELTGPELRAPGGRRYAVGDRILTLAPSRTGIVTSERGTITAVATAGLTARMDDGRLQSLDRDDLAADRLDHGYASTIHRAQGATVDTAHRLHDGGGRELAYVANSRARAGTTVHLVADSLDQATEDLRREWANEHRPRWALGLLAATPLADRQIEEIVLRRAPHHAREAQGEQEVPSPSHEAGFSIEL